VVPWPDQPIPGLLCGYTVRHSEGHSEPPFASLNLSWKTGDAKSAVFANRRLVERKLGISDRAVIGGRLTHGDTIVVFGRSLPVPFITRGFDDWPVFDGDAAVSDIPGLVLVMTYADCVPIVLYDPARPAIALVHAGWRGTALQIASKAAAALNRTFSADLSQVRAYIGPSIGGCCYEVGQDVHERLCGAYGARTSLFTEHGRVALDEANRQDLLAAGLFKSNIEVSGLCTSCRTDLFFSHRREHGATGRFGVFVGLI
jgi:YfiH family protein